MKQRNVLCWVLPLLLLIAGCGKPKPGALGPVSEEAKSFQEESGRMLVEHAVQVRKGSGTLLVITLKEEGVMVHPNQQQMLSGIKAAAEGQFSSVNVADIPMQQIIPGQGFAADSYSAALQRVGQADAVISLAGVPMGGQELASAARATPLVALLEPGISAETLQMQSKLPGSWTLLQLQPGANQQDLQSAYKVFRSN